MWQIGKKGIMIQFLVTLLLALIIFIPACYIASNVFFRTSKQAKDNYADFVKGLNDFNEQGQVGEKKSILLIMDEATAIVYFQKNVQKAVIEVEAKLPYTDYSIEILKPGQCDDTKNCLCLLRESDFEATVFDKGVKGKITVTPQKVVCAALAYNVAVESCSIGEGTMVNSYTCADSFMIERNLAKKSSVFVGSYYEIPRRTVLYFTKDSNAIKLVGNYNGQNE